MNKSLFLISCLFVLVSCAAPQTSKIQSSDVQKNDVVDIAKIRKETPLKACLICAAYSIDHFDDSVAYQGCEPEYVLAHGFGNNTTAAAICGLN